jgi:hypothetical protein
MMITYPDKILVLAGVERSTFLAEELRDTEVSPVTKPTTTVRTDLGKERIVWTGHG